MTHKDIFKKAHQIAHEILAEVGDYVIAFKIALKRVYRQKKLLDCHAKLWEKNGKSRIYFNNMDFIDYCVRELKISSDTLGGLSDVYYDCNTDTFINCNDFILFLAGTTKEKETIVMSNSEEKTYKLQMSDASLKARKQAALLGDFKALKGTVKQKRWAEHIRLEKLKKMSEPDIEFISKFNIVEKAAYWINQKDTSISKIIEDLHQYASLFTSRNDKCNSLSNMCYVNKVWTNEMKELQKEIDLADKDIDAFNNKLLGK